MEIEEVSIITYIHDSLRQTDLRPSHPRHRDLLQHGTPTLTQDPYVVVVLGKTKHKTKVHDEGGKKPHWNDVLAFKSPQATKL